MTSEKLGTWCQTLLWWCWRKLRPCHKEAISQTAASGSQLIPPITLSSDYNKLLGKFSLSALWMDTCWAVYLTNPPPNCYSPQRCQSTLKSSWSFNYKTRPLCVTKKMCDWAIDFLGNVGMRWAVVLFYFAWHEKRSLDLGRLALPDQVVAEDDPAKGDPHLLR